MVATGEGERKLSTEPLRWGLIGSGLIARAFAADLTATDWAGSSPSVDVTGESADSFADKFGVPQPPRLL